MIMIIIIIIIRRIFFMNENQTIQGETRLYRVTLTSKTEVDKEINKLSTNLAICDKK